MSETPNSNDISPQLQRLATIVQRHPDEALTTLSQFLDEAWLREAYRRTRKNGALGIDGRSAADFERDLDANLRSLLERAHTGRYRAPPVRRTYIPRGDGQELRPLGIPTFEDKVLQRAVAMILEEVYEPQFHDGSYGFRPRRSPHQALDALWQHLSRRGGGWVLEVDIERFFDTVDHDQLRVVLDKRVGDGVLRRLIGKWLNAGVMAEGQWQRLHKGTPQGGVISPVLANIFLDEVLDQWFEHTAKPRLRGSAALVRFADDAVLAFDREEDARRVWAALAKRFERYGLRLHPEKTRLVAFHRPRGDVRRPQPRPPTFDLLGFTHYWGRSRRGRWVIKRKMAKDRFARALRAINDWCRDNRHRRLRDQWLSLSRKLEGLYAYYGIIGNLDSLKRLRYGVLLLWRKWLARRSQRGRMPWKRFRQLLELFPLPEPRIKVAV